MAVVVALAAVTTLTAANGQGQHKHTHEHPECHTSPDEYGTGGTWVGPPLRFGKVTVTDPLFPRQWGLDQINAPEAWALGATGKGVIVAVIDDGIDPDHPDLAPNLIAHLDAFVPGPLPEGEREGQPDPIPPSRCAGHDGRFTNDPSLTRLFATSWEYSGHGSHVAGIAVAAANGLGGVGVAPEARLLSYRAVVDGGSTSRLLRRGLANGVRWATDAGAHVINISVAQRYEEDWPEVASKALRAAIADAWARGAVVVGAAGNSNPLLPDNVNPTHCKFPADLPEVICVGAVTRAGTPAHYSNRVTRRANVPFRAEDHRVGVFAPGGEGVGPLVGSPLERCGGTDAVAGIHDDGVWSTVPPKVAKDGPLRESPGTCTAWNLLGYAVMVGTSQAAPHVAGVAALLMGEGLTNVEVHDCLRRTSTNRGVWSEVDGYGIVDAERAVAECTRLGRKGRPGGRGGQ